MSGNNKTTKNIKTVNIDAKTSARTFASEQSPVHIQADKPEKMPKSKGPQSKATIDILLHRKPSDLLILLLDDTRSWYTSLLARESNQSYVYATNIIKVLNARDILFYERKGKRKIIKLTERGEKIAKALAEINQLSSHKN